MNNLPFLRGSRVRADRVGTGCTYTYTRARRGARNYFDTIILSASSLARAGRVRVMLLLSLFALARPCAIPSDIRSVFFCGPRAFGYYYGYNAGSSTLVILVVTREWRVLKADWMIAGDSWDVCVLFRAVCWKME